ncbi:MAG: DMT family transporter [Spiroplasma sp.]|nr:DMT family transporter [Spiroplasma sp.]
MSLTKVKQRKAVKTNHSNKKNDLTTKKRNFVLAGGMGISSAIFYSLTPLFVFFFADNPLTILYPIFIATIQELMSFIVVAITIGFQKWKEIQKPAIYWLNYTIIIPIIYFIIMGISLAIKNLIIKLQNFQVWIVALVGVLAGPISMGLLMIAALFLNDGTIGNIILNTAPIYCMILSHFILKQKINRVGLSALIITTLFTFGMLLNYFFYETINWKAIVGVCLAFIAALMYAFESSISDYIFHHKKIKLTNYEVVSVKSFISFWVMLIIALPIAATIDVQPWYDGWTLFKTSFNLYGALALLIYVSGLVMGFGRLIYFRTIQLSTGTYALATQLTMLIWTPALQILGNLLIPKINTQDLPWFYWLWSCLILVGLFLMTFNEEINNWLLKRHNKKTSFNN